MLWDFLKCGDVIDVIAPSSPPSNPDHTFNDLRDYFSNTNLKLRIPEGLIEPTPVLNEANTIENRVKFIIQALVESDSKAVWAILGGGWGTELLTALKLALPKNTKIKPILGYSDATALHVFFNQYMGWPSMHCIELGANGDVGNGWNKNKISEVLDLLTGKKTEVHYTVQVINKDQFPCFSISDTSVVGSNSLLVNCLNGSDDFTLDTQGKIIFLESIARSPGEMSRVLNGFRYSPLFSKAKAILLGSFILEGGKPNSDLVNEQFSVIREHLGQNVSVPLLFADCFGHGPVNYPLPLNTSASIATIQPGEATLRVHVNT